MPSVSGWRPSRAEGDNHAGRTGTGPRRTRTPRHLWRRRGLGPRVDVRSSRAGGGCSAVLRHHDLAHLVRPLGDTPARVEAPLRLRTRILEPQVNAGGRGHNENAPMEEGCRASRRQRPRRRSRPQRGGIHRVRAGVGSVGSARGRRARGRRPLLRRHRWTGQKGWSNRRSPAVHDGRGRCHAHRILVRPARWLRRSRSGRRRRPARRQPASRVARRPEQCRRGDRRAFRGLRRVPGGLARRVVMVVLAKILSLAARRAAHRRHLGVPRHRPPGAGRLRRALPGRVSRRHVGVTGHRPPVRADGASDPGEDDRARARPTEPGVLGSVLYLVRAVVAIALGLVRTWPCPKVLDQPS